MNKRGLSGIVTTLLIIVVVFIAVGLVWVVIQNVITEGLEEVGLQGINNNVKIEQVVDNGDALSVKVQRDQGDAEISKLKFVVFDGVDSDTYEVDVSDFNALETKTLSVPHQGIVKSIQVIPVLIDSSGNEKDGSASEKEFSDEEMLEGLGAISWWKLDGDARDSVGNNHGVVNDKVEFIVDSQRGSVADFPGNSSHTIDIVNILESMPSELTMSAFFKTEGDIGDSQRVIGKSKETSPEQRIDFYLRSIADGKDFSFDYEENDNPYTVMRLQTKWSEDVWYHMLATWDTTNGIHVYLDGVMETSNASATILPGDMGDENPFQIGRAFNGTIDDVIIFDKALSEEEVGSLYGILSS